MNIPRVSALQSRNHNFSVPSHIAIIMDGNGRWAQHRGRPRIYGHIRGCSRVRDVVRECSDLGVKALTLFAFSTENWFRPFEEVQVLMKLLRKWLIRERKDLMKLGVRVRAIGSLERLPAQVREVLEETIEISKHHEGLELTLALSYGGREELVEATKRLMARAIRGEILPEDMTEDRLSEELFHSLAGDPDLLIRTSGEVRISNFLLWQLAYTELYFSPVMWPDFTVDQLHQAIREFSSRERRFGLVSEQAQKEVPLHGTAQTVLVQI